MKSSKVTITSKNQITIPAQFVRDMHLQRNRQVKVRQQGNELILTPLPSLGEALKPVWKAGAPSIKGALTDDELKAATRHIGSRE